MCPTISDNHSSLQIHMLIKHYFGLSISIITSSFCLFIRLSLLCILVLAVRKPHTYNILSIYVMVMVSTQRSGCHMKPDDQFETFRLIQQLNALYIFY